MILKCVKVVAAAAFALVSLNVSGQDLLARQAPIDRKLKAVDSVALIRQIKAEKSAYPAYSLYPNWSNERVHAYGNTVTIPDTFRIDMTGFRMPTEHTKITSKFGPRRRRMHKGIDLKVLKGDTIRAAFNGKVRIKAFERRGYGYYVVLRHPNGLETIYGHLSKILVEENQIVRAGETIGLGGNTGRSTGSHLHFETRFLGQAINPAEIIDFENGVPHQDTYVFHNVKMNGRRSNIYTSSSDRLVYHRVKSGDTLGKIARIYGTSVNELCRLNGLKSTSVLRIGQSIRCSAGAVTSAKAGTSKPAASASVKQTVKTTVAADAAAVASINQTSDAGRQEATPVYHRVKSGDTLGAIAAKYGTTVSKLCELNGITKTTILKLGRSLRCS